MVHVHLPVIVVEVSALVEEVLRPVVDPTEIIMAKTLVQQTIFRR
jgi:hypothetical protein